VHAKYSRFGLPSMYHTSMIPSAFGKFYNIHFRYSLSPFTLKTLTGLCGGPENWLLGTAFPLFHKVATRVVFDKAELASMIELIDHVQKDSRIGNLHLLTPSRLSSVDSTYDGPENRTYFSIFTT
jgi:hypothetical protein